MKKSAIYGLIVLIISAALVITYFLTAEPNMKDAVKKYEKENYAGAIELLNNLIKSADYEKAEKMHYYRNMSLNRLIEELESDYEDDLKKTTLNNTDKGEFLETKKNIEDELNEYNGDLGCDLSLSVGTSTSSIISGGKFYNEFMSRYSGSSFVEELDFYELKKTIKKNPARFIDSVKRFYTKFPNSAYIPQIVEYIFRNLSSGSPSSIENEAFMKEIITKFAVKYPTSQEVSRIFISTGNNVNLRNSPGLNGKAVGKTVMGEILIQIDKSMDTMQVGDSRDYWYKIATLRGAGGWIFGKFLKPVEIDKLTIAGDMKTDNFRFEDSFQEWKDSNTPSSWNHIDGGNRKAFGFQKLKEKKVLSFSGEKGTSAGLFTRFITGKKFTVSVKAKVISGNFIELFKAVNGSTVYTLKLTDSSAILNQRTIPLDTKEWHNYEIDADNQGFAKLKIDGELVSAKINAESGNSEKDGIYLFNHGGVETAECLLESIKVK